MRDQQLQFLGNVFLKTITRSFGQALLTFSTVRPIPNKPFEVNPICFKGKIGRSGVQVEYPPPDSIAVMVRFETLFLVGASSESRILIFS